MHTQKVFSFLNKYYSVHSNFKLVVKTYCKLKLAMYIGRYLYITQLNAGSIMRWNPDEIPVAITTSRFCIVGHFTTDIFQQLSQMKFWPS